MQEKYKTKQNINSLQDKFPGKSPLILFSMGILTVVFIFALVSFLTLLPFRYSLFYYPNSNSTLMAENRIIPFFGVNKKYAQLVVSEWLLGPRVRNKFSHFTEEPKLFTSLVSELVVIQRKSGLYIDLPKSFAKLSTEKRQSYILGLRKSIRAALPFTKKIIITTGGVLH